MYKSKSCQVCTKKKVRRQTTYHCEKCPGQPGFCVVEYILSVLWNGKLSIPTQHESHRPELIESHGCLQNTKHDERKQQIEFYADKVEKKERSSKPKEKREKLSEEEKELRKERKLGRKRDRLEIEMNQEMKRRRDDEKASKILSTNGDIMEAPVHTREKHHRSRDISPYQRDRSHEKSEPRDKHRRSSEHKRR